MKLNVSAATGHIEASHQLTRKAHVSTGFRTFADVCGYFDW